MTSAPRPSVSRRTSLDEVDRGVVDAVVEPEVDAAGRGGSSLEAVASTGAPARLASWMAAIPTPLAPAWMSAVSPGWRRPNSNRQSSAVPKGTGTQAASSVVRPSGMAQQNGSPTARSSAWDPSRPTVTTRSPSANSAHRRAHRHHGARALVADDVGSLGDVPPQPVEGVAPFDADRLDPDQHLGRAHRPGRGPPRTGTPRARRSRSTPLPSPGSPPSRSDHVATIRQTGRETGRWCRGRSLGSDRGHRRHFGTGATGTAFTRGFPGLGRPVCPQVRPERCRYPRVGIKPL